MKIYWFGGPFGVLTGPVEAGRFQARLARYALAKWRGLGARKMRADWGDRIRCEGIGSITFAAGFHIENDVVIMGEGLVEFGAAISIGRFTQIRNCKRFESGEHVRIGSFCAIDATNGVRIGDHVKIGSGAKLLAFDRLGDLCMPHGFQMRRAAGISIGSNVWIGPGAIVHDGVTIGSNAVIAAGAIVTRNVLPNAFAGRRPGNAIRESVFGRSLVELVSAN